MSSVKPTWRPYRLEELAQLEGGGTPSRSNSAYFGGTIPWVTPTDIPSPNRIATLNTTAETISNSGLDNSSAKLIPRGSVLFSSRASIGKIAITDSPCATNQGFVNFIPKPDRIDPWFLGYLLCRFTNEIKALAGKTTFPEVPRGKLRSFEVKVPSLVEQRRIVAVIKECQERVEEIERLRTDAILESEAVLPSLLSETFVALAKRYKAMQIGSVALETRYGTSQKCQTQPGGLPILRIPNVRGGSITFSDLKYCYLGDADSAKIVLRNGDLLFVRTNGSRDLVGRCAVFEKPRSEVEYGFASYLIRVRLDISVLRPHFLAFFLNSTQGRTELDSRKRTSAGQFNINSENLRSVSLPIPPIAEQDSIIEILQDRQASARGLQAEMQKARGEEATLRDAILRKAFAGEL